MAVHNGAMVALVPSAEHADRLAVDGGEPADQLHCTLVYLGKGADIDDNMRQAIVDAVTAAVADTPQIDVDGFALSLFNPDRDEPCTTLGLSGAGLTDVRSAVVQAVATVDGFALPEQHQPWHAHLTLAYTDDTGMAERLVGRAGPLLCDRVRVAFAGTATDIPLVAPDEDEPEPDDEPGGPPHQDDDIRAAPGGTLLHARSDTMPDDSIPVRLGEDGPQIGRARAYIDRESLTPGRPLRFVAANEGRMADGIDLRMTGARLDRYRNNPVIGFGHNYYGRANLPIGRAANTEVAGSRLLMDVEMDPDDPFAMEVDRKIRAGYLSAMSIGFEVVRWQDGKGSYWEGGVAEEWELTESSIVPIPMDANALCVAGRSAPTDDVDRAWLRTLVDEFGLERVMGVFGPMSTRDVIAVGPPASELLELDVAEPLTARVDEESLARAIRAAFGDLLQPVRLAGESGPELVTLPPGATVTRSGGEPSAGVREPAPDPDGTTPDSAARAAKTEQDDAAHLVAAIFEEIN